MDIPLIAQIYVCCAGFGALFLTICAVMGAHGAGQGHAHAHVGGNAGVSGHIGHAGVGHGHAGGSHGASHSGTAHGQGTSSHTASNSTHTGSHNTHGAHEGQQYGSQTSQRAAIARTNHPSSTPVVQGKRDIGLLILTILNPTSAAAFAAWFGAIGIILWRYVSILPLELTLPIAAVGGAFGTHFTLNALGWLTRKMFSSVNFTSISLIGHSGEVTCGIPIGKIGEITVMAGGTRCTFSARCSDPTREIKRGDQVMIVDLNDDIATVELWNDDSGFDAQLNAGQTIPTNATKHSS